MTRSFEAPSTPRTLRSGFLASVARQGDAQALRVGGAVLTYDALDRRARQVAATLDRHGAQNGGPTEGRLTAVFGHRHETAFAGILGALYRGHGYVPLNPTFPVDRNRTMLERSDCAAVVVDPTGLPNLVELLGPLEGRRLVLVPDLEDVSELQSQLPGHTVLGASDLVDGEDYALGEADPNGICYLLFTSGSTGMPKGVMVAHRNVVTFVDSMVERYDIRPTDRFSNTFDLTFDLSAFDMFCAWERGACLCVPTAQQKMFPGKWVKKEELTVWFGVPSSGVLMNKLRMLKPDSYPHLRWVLFCGEALPADVVEAFCAAAPGATVENLYGPTELTIACTLYRWDPERSRDESHLGIVPIGEPYPGMRVRIVDESLQEVAPGEDGELTLSGPQVTLGYWKDPDRTAKVFVTLPGTDEVSYRTGDRVRKPEGGPLLYLGRVDNQIKIQGYRVELGEVEAIMREACGVDVAIALGWPRTSSGADGIVGFVEGKTAVPDEVLGTVQDRLPTYMKPSRIATVPSFPLNANGKVDRKALLALLEKEEG